MKLNEQKTKEILLKGNYITQEDAKKAGVAFKKRKIGLIDYLFGEGILTPDLLGQAIAEFFKVNYADLNSNQPPREQVLKIPENIAKKFRVVLFKEEPKSVVITTDNPSQVSLLLKIQPLFSGKKVTITYSLSEDIEANFIHYKKSLDTRFSQIIKKKTRIAPELIDEIFKDALTHQASDIHFEPQEKEVVIRFRVDGVLYEAGRISKEYFENILNRIKVQAQMKIDEHRAAQDGAIRYQVGNNVIDTRVSIVPILDGEKIAIRVLSHYVRNFSLGDIGFSSKHQKAIVVAGKKPFGMILVTGPTGSGKSTTLYALLKHISRPEVNITTIEDPVEYRLAGVNQIQVNLQTNLTFAKGLRSIVRQDPDIILVGEIRDEETADIGVNAALTGHLLLSTFHANDAATTIPRLLDMKAEPFLLASTLELIIAQRLIRKICEHCRYSYSVSQDELAKKFKGIEKLLPQKQMTLYKGKGCNACNNTGYKGRTAIFEFIEVTPKMQELILKSPSRQEIWELAKSQGVASLFEDGLDKVKNGVTTLEELYRVAEPPENVGTEEIKNKG